MLGAAAGEDATPSPPASLPAERGRREVSSAPRHGAQRGAEAARRKKHRGHAPASLPPPPGDATPATTAGAGGGQGGAGGSAPPWSDMALGAAPKMAIFRGQCPMDDESTRGRSRARFADGGRCLQLYAA
jgi:hypothetical protein